MRNVAVMIQLLNRNEACCARVCEDAFTASPVIEVQEIF